MAGLSQEKLADVVGVKQSAVAAWEGGRNKPDPDAIRKIALACGVTADWLLEMPEDFAGMDKGARELAEQIARLRPEDKKVLEKILAALAASDDQAAAK